MKSTASKAKAPKAASFIRLNLAPKGFRAGGIAAGIKKNGAPDLAAIAGDKTLSAAAVTTRNVFAAGSVKVTRDRLPGGCGRIAGVVVNAGNANACTGTRGVKDAVAMTALAEKCAGAKTGSFVVGSTGVIGRLLPMEKMRAGMPELFKTLRARGWEDFARAIMTTDIRPKVSQRSIALPGGGSARILGVCKGAGMIAPNMATMLAYIATDFPLAPAQAGAALRGVVGKSFNAITVDSDNSTNDTLLLMSSGAALPAGKATAALRKKFQAALLEVAEDLAKQIVRDGEGATKVIEITIEGARNDEDANRLARSIADSPLCKTAIFGHDPNWGRIAMALGKAGVDFDPKNVSIAMQGMKVMRGGLPLPFSAKQLSQSIARSADVSIAARIGKGPGRARIWASDLTYEYVRINADYTT